MQQYNNSPYVVNVPIHYGTGKDGFSSYSGDEIAFIEAEREKERKMKAYLQAKAAQERGKAALAKELKAKEKRDSVATLKARKAYLEMEKQKAVESTITYCALPQHNMCRPILKEISDNRENAKFNSKPSGLNVQVIKHVVTDEPTGFEAAVVDMERERLRKEVKEVMTAKRNWIAEERFRTALNSQRIDKDYEAVTRLLEQAERLHHQEAAHEGAKRKDHLTACPPVDKVTKKTKQQKMERMVEKALKSKEHAIEDIEGYSDKYEEKYKSVTKSSSEEDKRYVPSTTADIDFESLFKADSFDEQYRLTRESSVDDFPLNDIMNTAYIETSPLTSISAESGKSYRKIGHMGSVVEKRSVSTQVYETMFPISRGIQVDLGPKEDRKKVDDTDIAADNAIDKKGTMISTGTQTDPFIPIPVLVDSSECSWLSSSSYYSLPPNHGKPVIPPHYLPHDLKLTSPEGSFPIPSRNQTPVSTEKVIPKSKMSNPKTPPQSPEEIEALKQPGRYFPPILDKPQPDLSDYFRKLASKCSDKKDSKATLQKVHLQAVPLSEPIRERSSMWPFLSDDTPTESPQMQETPQLSPLSQSIPEMIKHIVQKEIAKQNVPLPSNEVNKDKSMTVSFDQNVTIPKQINTISALSGLKSDSLRNLFDLSQSYDIRNEELANISLLANLSQIEITNPLEDHEEQSTSHPSLDDVFEDAPSAEDDEKVTDKYKMLRHFLYNRLKKEHPTLEPISPPMNVIDMKPVDKPKRKFCVDHLRSGEPYTYHELSTIQEMDSALTNTQHSINAQFEPETSKRLSNSFAMEFSTRPSTRRELSNSREQTPKKQSNKLSTQTVNSIDITPSSLLVETSEVSHLLENIKILSPEDIETPGSGDATIRNKPFYSKIQDAENRGNDMNKISDSSLCFEPLETFPEGVLLSNKVASNILKGDTEMQQKRLGIDDRLNFRNVATGKQLNEPISTTPTSVVKTLESNIPFQERIEECMSSSIESLKPLSLISVSTANREDFLSPSVNNTVSSKNTPEVPVVQKTSDRENIATSISSFNVVPNIILSDSSKQSSEKSYTHAIAPSERSCSTDLLRFATMSSTYSGSAESLRHMFTESKIDMMHQSTPIKLSHKDTAIPIENDMQTETQSECSTIYGSPEKPRCASEDKTLLATVLSPPCELSQSMLSFLRHEKSALDFNDEHVSLIAIQASSCHPSAFSETSSVFIKSVSTSAESAVPVATVTTSYIHHGIVSKSPLTDSTNATAGSSCCYADVLSGTPSTLFKAYPNTLEASVSVPSAVPAIYYIEEIAQPVKCTTPINQPCIPAGYIEKVTTANNCITPVNPPRIQDSDKSNPKSGSAKIPKSEYVKRTNRLYNNLAEVKQKKEKEEQKKMIAQNKERVKELQMKLLKKPTPKRR